MNAGGGHMEVYPQGEGSHTLNRMKNAVIQGGPFFLGEDLEKL